MIAELAAIRIGCHPDFKVGSDLLLLHTGFIFLLQSRSVHWVR